MYLDTAGDKPVEAYAIRLARGHLDAKQKGVLREAASLRNLGRVVIPNMIWDKPGKLHPDELLLVKKYPEYGYRMLMQIDDFEEVAKLIYCHQEQFNGAGYPRRLQGEQIPLGARILSVAAAIDASTSDRPYRQARSFAAASEEILRWAGQQFDPKIANAFRNIPEAFWAQAKLHPEWVHD